MNKKYFELEGKLYKKCPRCKKSYPYPDGFLKAYCLSCKKEYDREYNKKHKKTNQIRYN